MRIVAVALAALIVAVILALLASPVLATKSDKVYVCHATSSENNPFVTLYVPATETGYPQGHFTENGTQEAGHETDYLGYCEGDEPSQSPESSSSPSTSPSASTTPSSSPSEEPSSSPTVTPTPSLTPGPSSSPTSSPVVPSPRPSPLPTLPATDTEG